MGMLKITRWGVVSVVASILVACGGGSGSSSGSSVSSSPAQPPTSEFTPIKAAPLSLSSYENRIASVEIMGQLSLIDNFGAVKTGSSINYLSTLAQQYHFSNSWAYGDFFGDGNYALIAHSFEYDFTVATKENLGRIKFYKQSANGWVDSTSEILTKNEGCLHPRKLIVSDFNLDNKPDVFINCTGVDSPPFPGEASRLLMSRADGKYDNQAISWASNGAGTYTHGSSAADINGDGYADIVVTDHVPSSAYMGTGALINNKDGTFTFKPTIFSGVLPNKTSYTAELIKVANRNHYDLFLSGHGSDASNANYLPQIFENDGNGNFSNPKVFPVVSGYGLGLDVIYDGGYFYILRTTDSGTVCCENFYSAALIQKVKYPEMTPTDIIYDHKGNYVNNSSWVNWIAFKGRNVVSMDADFGLIIPK